MTLLSAVFAMLLPLAAAEKPAIVVSAADSPVRLDRAVILTTSEGPPVVLYSATNATDNDLEQFMVIAFVFDADGTLKARQTAPGRRLLEAHTTKYSTLVIDGSPVGPTDLVVVGVNQAQRSGSDAWWRTDLQAMAAVAARKK